MENVKKKLNIHQVEGYEYPCWHVVKEFTQWFVNVIMILTSTITLHIWVSDLQRIPLSSFLFLETGL